MRQSALEAASASTEMEGRGSNTLPCVVCVGEGGCVVCVGEGGCVVCV